MHEEIILLRDSCLHRKDAPGIRVARLLSRAALFPALLLAAALGASSTASAQDWQFFPTDPLGDGLDLFYAVSGTGSDDVWGVGATDAPDRRSLIEHFDGTQWTQVPAADTGVPGPFETLNGVAAIAPDRAVTVGSYTPSGSISQPLAMEWDGSSWSLLSTPVIEGGGAYYDVTETPGGDVVATGWKSGVAFLAFQSGGSWDLEFAPPVGGFRNRFYGMYARTDDEIWVVGTKGDGFGDFDILIQRYDGGSSFTTFDVPTPGFGDSLYGVIAFAPDDVWTAGYYYHTEIFHYQPLIMHYDGTEWTQVELPLFPEGSCELRGGITGTGPEDLYACGTYATAEGLPRPFVLHYDGVEWSEVDLPPTGGSAEWFRGMTTTPEGDVWAVGQYFDGTSTEPMAFRHVASEVDVVATPLRTEIRPGEQLEFDVSVSNGSDRAKFVDVWIDVIKPSGAPYAGNPVLGPRSVTLAAGSTIARTVGLRIPSGAPPSGPYTLQVNVGTFPADRIASDTFPFVIIP